MDGASWLRKLLSITVPLVVPAITICLFVSITASFRTFELSFGMTRGSPMRTTETLSYNIFVEAFTFSNYGVACAKGVILMTITAVVGFFQVRTTSKREVAL
jgi:raffinose/stachyose/melibiose transport system permease protein